jgi:4-hydroxy-tetrahydrodipicolinate synthase
MESKMTNMLQGVYLPVVTPFLNGQVDYDSYIKLLSLYSGKGINGIVALATTGEVSTIEDDEYLKVLEITVDTVKERIPIYAGISTNSTKKASELIRKLDKYRIAGYLVTSPYYSLPSQQGIYDHFMRVSESTDRSIIIYNIPYRTGRNIENDTIFRLSLSPNIIGIKDCCGNINQTIELIRDRKPGFSVLTGEDSLFYFNIVQGGDGGMLASAHLNTETYLDIFKLVKDNDHASAIQKWNKISKAVPLLFKEPNPAPLKYVLARKGLISSDEVRLPLSKITDSLKEAFNRMIEKGVI